MEADGRLKEPIWPISGRMMGKGDEGLLNETWRTGVVLMMEWIVWRS